MKNTKIILIFLSLFLIYGLFLFINKNNLEYKQLDFTSSKNINKCNQKEKDLKVQKTLKPNNSKVLDYVFENFEVSKDDDNESKEDESEDNESKDGAFENDTNKPKNNISNNMLGFLDDTSLSLSKNNKSLNLNYSEYNNIKDYVNLYNSDLRKKHKQHFNSLKLEKEDIKNSLSNDTKLLKEKENEIQRFDKEHQLKEVIKNINSFKGIGAFKSFFR